MQPITFKNVSSNIKAARYDASSQTLEVDFQGGSYRYTNVPPQLVEEFVGAKSAGTWFAHNIKNHADKFPAEKLGAVAPAAETTAPALPADATPVVASSSTDETAAPAGTTPPLKVDFETTPDDDRQLARALYAAYTDNSGGLAWDGRPCPTWDKLGNAVRSHWCATAIAAARITEPLQKRVDSLEEQLKVSSSAASDPSSLPSQAALVAENRRLKSELDRLAKATGSIEERALAAAVTQRTEMLQGEVDGLRAKVGALETEKRNGFKPWAARAGRVGGQNEG